MSAEAVPVPNLADFVALGELARVVYRQCRDSPGQYRELSSDAQQVVNIVEDLQDLIKSFQLDDEARIELEERGETCNEVLVDLNTILTKYKYMSAKSREVIDAAGWENQEAKAIRARLTSTVPLLNAFYNSLTTSSFIRVQKVLDQYAAETSSGARVAHAVSGLNAMDDPKDMSSWPELVDELKGLGLTSIMIDEHQTYIVEKLITLRDRVRVGSDTSQVMSRVSTLSPNAGSESLASSNDFEQRTSTPSSEGGIFAGPRSSGSIQQALPPPYPGYADLSRARSTNAPQAVQPGMIPTETEVDLPLRSMSFSAPQVVSYQASQTQRSASISAPQTMQMQTYYGQRSQSFSAPQPVHSPLDEVQRSQSLMVPVPVRGGLVVTAYETATKSGRGNYLQKFSEAAFLWNQKRYTEALRILPQAYISTEDPLRAYYMDAIARHTSAVHASYVGEFEIAKAHFIDNIIHLGGPRSDNERCYELRVVSLRWLGDTCLQLGDVPNALFVWALAIEGYSILATRNIKPWGGISKSMLFEFPKVLEYEKARFRFQNPQGFVFSEYGLEDRERAIISAMQTAEHIKNICNGKRKFKTSESNFNDFTRPPTSRTPMVLRHGPPVIAHSSEWFEKVLMCDPFLDMENTISLVLHKQPRPGSGLQYSPWSSGEVTINYTMRDESWLLGYFCQEFSRDLAKKNHLIGLKIVPEWNRLCLFATIGNENIVAMARLTVRIYKPIQKRSEKGTKYCVQYSYNTTEPSRPNAQPRGQFHESTDLEPWFKGKVEAIASQVM